MSNVTKLSTLPQSIGDAALFDAKMLGLIRRMYAKDTNDDEFNTFVSIARTLRLNPLKKQIYAFVYHKDDPKKRQLTLVTAISGLRTIAERTGNYRPGEDAPEFHFDDLAKGPTNPLGLIKAVVKIFKFSHQEWHPITAEAYWDEAAPIKDEWAYDDASGKRKPTGRRELDGSGQWVKMPRLMLAKVAEAAALRKAWPDELSGLYEEAEMDRAAFIDLTPTEAVEAGETQARLERIGGKDALICDFLKGDMTPLEMVPVGQFADRALAFIEAHRDEPSQIEIWRSRNRAALQEFWAKSPADALELKRTIEASIADGAA